MRSRQQLKQYLLVICEIPMSCLSGNGNYLYTYFFRLQRYKLAFIAAILIIWYCAVIPKIRYFAPIEGLFAAKSYPFY